MIQQSWSAREPVQLLCLLTALGLFQKFLYKRWVASLIVHCLIVSTCVRCRFCCVQGPVAWFFCVSHMPSRSLHGLTSHLPSTPAACSVVVLSSRRIHSSTYTECNHCMSFTDVIDLHIHTYISQLNLVPVWYYCGEQRANFRPGVSKC